MPRYMCYTVYKQYFQENIFIFVFFFFRNVLLVSTEMAAALTWAAVCPVTATVWLMSVRRGQGGAW